MTFLKVLRDAPQYRALRIGQVVSTFGTALTYVALPRRMDQLTRKACGVAAPQTAAQS